MTRFRSIALFTAGCAAASAIWGYLCAADRGSAEFDRLERLLDIKTGSRVADVGAGKGEFGFRAAERVGPAGHVFLTEIDSDKLANLRNAAKRRKLDNVSVIEGAEKDTRLPADCCDAVYLRHVYHHITQPEEINRSIYQALKPGGLVAVIDFPPKKLLAPFKTKGVPSDRGGHGVTPDIVVRELKAAGLEIVRVDDRWDGSDFCVVFRKQ